MTRNMMFLVAMMLPVLASAQTFPTKTVRITSPYSTGIGPDLFARALADTLQKEWGQPVVVESRPGANGFIAIEALKKSQPDGHELLILADSHLTINPLLFKKVPYNVETDMVPVSGLYRTYFFVAVKSDGPYQSIVRKISADTQKALANPDMKKRIDALGFEGMPSNPEQIAEMIRNSLGKNAEIIKRIGVTAD